MRNYTAKLSSAAQKVNILMVDDRPENLLALENVLTCPDYHLVRATSGEEALKHVLTENFAVILLDVQMPGMDGFETARIIKSRDMSMHIPIIFITAISQAMEHVKHGYSVGAIDYIFKPFHPETLKMKVEAFVKLHQYQEQIKLQNQLLKVIGETSIDTIATLDEKGRLLTANPALWDMFGYTEEELLGHPIDQLVPGLFENGFDEQAVGTVIETVALRKNAGYFPADIQIGEASVEGHRIYICSIRDVTERKLLEEERFRKIFDSTPCLVALRSRKDRRYINVNESWVHHTGFHYDEVINQTSDVLQYIIDSDEMGELVRNAKISFLTKSGDLREGLLSTEVMVIHGEECLLHVITDITDRVFLEKEMARFDRLNIMGEMAAGIVHEIRNPMTTVRGFLQMSKDTPATDYIDIMIEELDRAHNIITDFLSVSKPNPTKRKLKELHPIVETLFPLIQAKALCTNIDVKLELERCRPLSLDEKEIRQLILNLSLNGLEAMSAGGTLTIKTYQRENEVILEIQDEGCGIKEELLEKIGTPFFSTKVHGTGLGLSVCHGVAARHGAEIKVKTSKDGTRFFVHFKKAETGLTGLAP
ncbi:response regulator [Ammoniphilus sp. 3BR4]|uniref:response regulator n=1 Tax=Ammoniphilus sp. 3BR4 TaxID=3158265 RepID=UPI003465622D